ncbi:S-layer homology domain-containing protein [Agathobaculum butyriciproducens]|uniref:S-layer homology domain-containing protein n=1 Tax=Agathobaculum butyriciproducens TaxID=1628085 RepID=UPI003A8DDB26
MKRRLLSAFLAVMMVLTMAPVAFAADTSVDSYDSLVEAINSASDGDTITLNGDIDVQRTLVVTKKLTLDLAGHKLYNTKDLWDAPTEKDNNWSLISVRENGDLTITGNGTLDAKKDDCYAVDVQDETAKATLENGTFVGNITTVYVFEGTLVVKDGSYSIKQLNSNGVQNQYGLTINCYDQNYKNGTAKVLITGGTFAHFNPVDNAAEGTGTNFATSGYETVEGTDGLYTAQVKSDNAAAIDDVQYATLADAVAAANNGDTVTLLKNTVEDVVIPAGKTITLDLNGKKLTNKTGHTITVEQGATLTINGEGTVDNVTHQKTTIYNKGTVTLNGGTYDRSKEDGIKDSNTYYTLLNHGTMTVANVTVNNKGGYSSLFENGYFNQKPETKNGIANPILTIKSGNFTGGINTVKNDDDATMIIDDGTFANYAQAAFQNHNIATINGGTFDGSTVYAILNCGVCTGNDAEHDKHQLIINDGKFSGKIRKGNDENGVHYDFGSIAIKGGYFTVDPTTYCAEGKTGVASGDKKYPFTVGDIVNNVKVVPSGSTVSTGDMDGKSDVVKNAMETARDAIGTRNTTIEGLAAVGSIEATEIDSDEVEYETEQLKKQGVSVEGKTVTFYIRPYMGITVMDATVENNVITSVTYNIVPQIQKIVSTATSVQDIRFNGDNKNAIRMNCQVPEVTTPITLSLPLPTGFATENLKVKHEKNGKLVGYHDTTYNTADNTITFTNDKGFSTFTVLSDARSTTIQFTDKDNHNIGSAKSYGPSNVNDALPTTAAESGYVFNGWKFEGIDGVYTTLTDELLTKLAAKSGTVSATPDFSKRSSGSSGGSSSGKTTYKVTTSAVNNGGVNASPSSAEKGATITITLSPDKGYKLDKLTVTDGSGKTVSTVKKSDTVYTFTMPASAVKVGVSYVKATETPSETKFNDVSANDWFASAVDYVTGKGMMNGTADNTFSPKANTTRGMVVTVLYRLENQPSTSAASFTDVASGAYYANAVAWANANGIVSGYGSGKFGPNDKVTREQLAAILYRYAQYKKYDVSVGEDTNILSYDDAQSISSYAIPAIQWACGAGVVTGKSGSKLDSKGNATRAEVAAMLMRFCENVK